MKSKAIASGTDKTWLVIFETGDELMAGLLRFAKDNKLSGSHFTAIGALQSATTGYFDWEQRKYITTEINEQVEVLVLAGDIALENGEPKVHAHTVLGKRDGTAHGGHVLKAIVRPTLEVVLNETPQDFRRIHDPESGLALIRP